MIGFYGLLRTGEILKLTSQDFSIGKSPRTLVVNLGLTKGGARQGALESVTIHDEYVINLVQAFQFTASRGDKLLPNGGGDFRKVFSSLVEELDISDWGFRPYSLRRGGATEHFRAFNSLSATTVRGRWASAKMARIYLNDGLATLAGFSFEKQHAKLCFFQKLCVQTCTMPRR
jgi:integrase